MAEIRIGIVGATGYLGQELIRLLLAHPKTKLTYLAYSQSIPKKISEIIPAFSKIIELECRQFNANEAAALSDLLFLALPASESDTITDELLRKGRKVIDLSAAFRLKDDVVYGLPELYRKDISKAKLVANPGCYPTSIILGCAPLIKENLVKDAFIIADSKSGLTGAGKRLENYLLFSEADENISPYKINEHQHIIEVSQKLSKLSDKKMDIIFVPQIVPMRRGILSTLYIKLARKISDDEAGKIYKNFYKDEQFVRIRGYEHPPQTRDVSQTNFCDIAVRIARNHSVAIVISCIDNLTKGGAGQAVQNMNIMCGFKETEGLL